MMGTNKLFAALLFFSLLVITVFGSPSVSAIEENQANIPLDEIYMRGDIPQNDGLSLECVGTDGGTYKHRGNLWMSSDDLPEQKRVPVNSVQDSLRIRFNALQTQCNSVLSTNNSSGSIVDRSFDYSRFKIISTTVAEENNKGSLSISAPANENVNVFVSNTWPEKSNLTTGLRFAKGIDDKPYSTTFTLSGLNSLPAGESRVIVTVEVRNINRYYLHVDGQDVELRCAVPTNPVYEPKGLDDPGCPTVERNMTIIINKPIVELPMVSCTTNIVSSGPIEPNKPFMVEITGEISGSSLEGLKAVFAIRNTDTGATEAGPVNQSWETWSLSKTFTFDVPGGIRDVGNYRVDGRINWTGSPVDPDDPTNKGVSCDKPFEISYVPYMKFYGNDIYAGATFMSEDPACVIKESDIIGDSIIDRDAKIARGSSGEYASFATGGMDQLFTAGRRTYNPEGLPTTVAEGLAFGNFGSSGTTEATTKTLKGDYNGERCLDFTKIVPDGVKPITSNSGDLRSILGEVNVSGNVYVIVDGDLNVNTNITLDDAWAGIKNIPNLVVLVNGDIIINRNVTDMQGIYIAQPDSSGRGGNVYTCGNVALIEISSLCTKQLRFKGALVAKHVDFYRSFGLLSKDSTENEPVGSSTISESFEFLPEIYVQQTRTTNKADLDVKYDFITSLPPVL